MARIVILGAPGSGKTTLAIRIGDRLGLPVHHTDRLGLLPGWKRVPFPAYRQRIEAIVRAERWVIDGNSPRTFDLRLPRCNLVIWLRPPVWRSLLNVFWREIRYFGRSRPATPPGCRSFFRWELFRRVLAFEHTDAPKIAAALHAYGVADKVIEVRRARLPDVAEIEGRLTRRP